MKKYFSQLRPLERRLAVAFAVILFLVLNWLFIWPHFSDLEKLRQRGRTARQKLELYQTAITQAANYQKQVKNLESQGGTVTPEDQAINFMRTIQTQSLQSHAQIYNTSRQTTHTNQFFIELTQNLNVVADDQQLVDFLYKLGSSVSMVRVRNLELQPDASHQHLNANMQLIASYQKNPQTNSKSATAKAK
ncbi:MAG TPA: hypothetical protein VHG89_11445 [Verrucomicrobiae bacterium]|nr:hypothetical protein [Verrucomicrobiae bacterium]